MQVWMTLLLALQMLSALAMIGLVLVQHGKGADMGASFGSSASGSLFGATGSANFLSRSTAVCAALFFCCTLALAFTNSKVSMRGASSGTSVLDQAAPAASAASAAAGAIPKAGSTAGATPAAAVASAAAATSAALPAAIPAAIPATPGAAVAASAAKAP